MTPNELRVALAEAQSELRDLLRKRDDARTTVEAWTHALTFDERPDPHIRAKWREAHRARLGAIDALNDCFQRIHDLSEQLAGME